MEGCRRKWKGGSGMGAEVEWKGGVEGLGEWKGGGSGRRA